jgi:hypothetical protein
MQFVECVLGKPYSSACEPIDNRATCGTNGRGEQKQSFMKLETYTPTHIIYRSLRRQSVSIGFVLLMRNAAGIGLTLVQFHHDQNKIMQGEQT